MKIEILKKIRISIHSKVGILFFATLLLLYLDNPKHPFKADDKGWNEEGVQKVVNANNQFAFELYGELNKLEEGNIFFSPFSIFSAMAMTYEGARGKTAEEIKSVFYFPSKIILRRNFARIYNLINEREQEQELKITNALWVQKNYYLLKDYIQTVERYYGGKAQNVDFVNETEKTRQIINKFIEDKTNNRIRDLIPKGVLNALTRLVLTNAIYFKGVWMWQFDPENTTKMPFRVNPEKVVEVWMMYMKPEKARFNYAKFENLQILELPYKGNKISMLILLPKKSIKDIEPLTIEKLNEWKEKMRETKLDEIYIPKFEFTKKYFLKESLKAMGMPTAFSLKADFTGMTGNKELYISSVIHQAYIKVDEKGTEAAGATAVVMELKALMPGKIFKADHPFIFIIQDKETGNILFMGKVTNPSV